MAVLLWFLGRYGSVGCVGVVTGSWLGYYTCGEECN